jgi:hypothetical protein
MREVLSWHWSKGEVSLGNNFENFMQLLREEAFLWNENIDMPKKIAEALDKLKFSGWNSSNQQSYEGEVQEMII